MSKKTVVPNEVWADGRLTLGQLRVLGALYSYACCSTTVCPTRAQLAQCCGVHPANITRATNALEKLGWIRKSAGRGRGKRSRYTLLTPKTPPAPVPQSECLGRAAR